MKCLEPLTSYLEAGFTVASPDVTASALFGYINVFQLRE